MSSTKILPNMLRILSTFLPALIVNSKFLLFDVLDITKTCRYNVDPLKPYFYIVKLGFTGVCIIFLISAKEYRLWVLIRTASARQF